MLAQIRSPSPCICPRPSAVEQSSTSVLLPGAARPTTSETRQTDTRGSCYQKKKALQSIQHGIWKWQHYFTRGPFLGIISVYIPCKQRLCSQGTVYSNRLTEADRLIENGYKVSVQSWSTFLGHWKSHPWPNMIQSKLTFLMKRGNRQKTQWTHKWTVLGKHIFGIVKSTLFTLGFVSPEWDPVLLGQLVQPAAELLVQLPHGLVLGDVFLQLVGQGELRLGHSEMPALEPEKKSPEMHQDYSYWLVSWWDTIVKAFMAIVPCWSANKSCWSTPRIYVFPPCSHLEFELAVGAENYELKVSFHSSSSRSLNVMTLVSIFS